MTWMAAGAVRADATNVLLAHVALTSLPARAWPDINELEIEEGAFAKAFDLVVLLRTPDWKLVRRVELRSPQPSAPISSLSPHQRARQAW